MSSRAGLRSCCPCCFLGGVQLLSIGVLGEYVGKIYMETKRRPRFIAEKATSTDLAITAAQATEAHFAE